MCYFCTPNTCDTVLWQNLLELLTTWAEHKTQMNCAQKDLSVTYLICYSKGIVSFSIQAVVITFYYKPNRDLILLSCVLREMWVLLVAFIVMLLQILWGKGAPQQQGRVADMQKLLLPDSEGSQHNLPWQPGGSSWAGWKNTQSNCRLAREVRGALGLVWMPPKQSQGFTLEWLS